MMEKSETLPDISEDIWDCLRRESRPLVVYGTGDGAEKLITRLYNLRLRPSAVFASDGFVRDRSFLHYRVESFSEICTRWKEFVILLAFGTSRPEVLRRIYDMADRYPLWMPDLPMAGEEYFTASFYRRHRAELEQVYALLADELSRQIFLSVIRYKLTGDIRHLREGCCSEEACYACLRSRPIRLAIDGGAYNGDTVYRLFCYRPEVEEVLAVEADRRNYNKLERYAASDPEHITAFYGALWRHTGTGMFGTSGNRNASMYGGSYGACSEEVPLLTVDGLAVGRHVDYIKYDIEGAEAEALYGSRRTIQNDRPMLAVSVYHRSEDLFRIPLLLHDWNPSYRFRLRRTECLPAWEITLYAT